MATRRKKVEEVIEELEDELEEALDELEEAEEEADGGGTMSAKEVAAKLKVDPRTFRKFLRSKYGKVGQGNRWLLPIEDFDELKVAFEAYQKPKKEPEPEAEVETAVDEELEELEDLDDLDELEEV